MLPTPHKLLHKLPNSFPQMFPQKFPHKSSLVLALATAAASIATPAVAGGGTGGGPAHQGASQLVITVTESGDPSVDGRYELDCDPAGGTHPEPQEACDAIQRAEDEAEGGDAFAPVPENALCTYMYGGPATAEVEGTWEGEPVSATFERSNGCEIARWDRLVPALPRIAGDRA
jgi:hypothetical protein